MKIELTKKQFEGLVAMSQVSGFVLGILGDTIPDKGGRFKKMSKDHEDLERYLLGFAHDFGQGRLVREHSYGLDVDDDVFDKYAQIMKEYDDFVFWDQLENRLARRDFYKTITKEEDMEAKKTGWLPDRFRKIEDEYRKEFEKHDVDRLEIRL